MSSVSITPSRVIFSNGLFDSNRAYVRQSGNGNVLWPNNTSRTIGSTFTQSQRLVHYKNGIGGVLGIAGYTMNTENFRMQL